MFIFLWNKLYNFICTVKFLNFLRNISSSSGRIANCYFLQYIGALLAEIIEPVLKITDTAIKRYHIPNRLTAIYFKY